MHREFVILLTKKNTRNAWYPPSLLIDTDKEAKRAKVEGGIDEFSHNKYYGNNRGGLVLLIVLIIISKKAAHYGIFH